MKIHGQLLIFLFLLPACSFAQYFSIDTVKGHRPDKSTGEYIFPRLTCKTNQSAADAINKTLREDFLNLDSGNYEKSIFEKVWGDSDDYLVPLSDISFEVKNNSNTFFCITISATGCGAYCEDFTRYYVFDSKTGSQIPFSSLFTKTGLQSISDSLRISKNSRTLTQINTLKILATDTVKTTQEDRENIEFGLEGLRGCIDTSTLPSYDNLDYILDKKELIIFFEGCLPHVNRAEDDVDYHFVFALKRIKQYLSPYSKKLLNL